MEKKNQLTKQLSHHTTDGIPVVLPGLICRQGATRLVHRTWLLPLHYVEHDLAFFRPVPLEALTVLPSDVEVSLLQIHHTLNPRDKRRWRKVMRDRHKLLN